MTSYDKDIFFWTDYLAKFQQAAEACGFSGRELAQTEAGPIVAWQRKGKGPPIYLSSGIHGDEPAGPLALLELMQEKLLKADLSWYICPVLNPTGLKFGKRENAEGVDLNRDYLLRTSNEVKAHAAWLESIDCPQLFLSLHEDWEENEFYFYEINLGGDDPELAGRIIKAVTPWFPPHSGALIDGHIPRGPGWIYHAAEADVPEGWPEAIFLAKRGCPLSLTFETPTSADIKARIAAHCAAVGTACAFAQDKWSRG